MLSEPYLLLQRRVIGIAEINNLWVANVTTLAYAFSEFFVDKSNLT
jgi:hypothetical protein